MEGCRKNLALACYANLFVFSYLVNDWSYHNNYYYAPIIYLRIDKDSNNNGKQEFKILAI